MLIRVASNVDYKRGLSELGFGEDSTYRKVIFVAGRGRSRSCSLERRAIRVQDKRLVLGRRAQHGMSVEVNEVGSVDVRLIHGNGDFSAKFGSCV